MMFEQEPLRQITAEGQIGAYKHDGFWQPMDTFQEFTLLELALGEGQRAVEGVVAVSCT